MRPDLALTATVSGEPMEFIARDVPTGVFFLGFEDTFPGAECFARLTPKQQRDNVLGFEAWADALLCRAMLEPRLTPELIQRLGSARDELAVGYLWGVGYHTPSLKEREQLVPPQAMDGPSQARHTWREDYAALIAVPPPNIKLAIREMASKARTAPHLIWTRWPISTFIWTWRVALQDDLKRRAAKAGISTLPSSDLMERVGRELS